MLSSPVQYGHTGSFGRGSGQENERMTLLIDLPPEVEARLQQEATRHGLGVVDYARSLIEHALPPAAGDRQRAAIALLESWAAEDATDDPDAIRAAEKELKAFKEAINRNRAGERPIYP